MGIIILALGLVADLAGRIVGKSDRGFREGFGRLLWQQGKIF